MKQTKAAEANFMQGWDHPIERAKHERIMEIQRSSFSQKDFERKLKKAGIKLTATNK